MKIGIVGIFDNTNFGNRLQNYALQEILSDIGNEVVTFRNFCGPNNDLKAFIKRCGYEESILYCYLRHRELIPFLKFNRRNIRLSHKLYFYNRSNYVCSDKCDIYCIGSDQVWNPELDRYTPFNFVEFDPGKPIFSYAASFGVSDVSEESYPELKNYFDKLSEISVREEEGQYIIKKLSGRDAELLIDPTLMLDKESWKKVSTKILGFDYDTPYLLTYFLGEKSEERNLEIQKFAKDNNLKVYNLKYDRRLECIGPGEFLSLFDSASLVVTDSFHACVFSFLFDKPFYVYARDGKYANMMSRIETFLKVFDLERKGAYNGLPNEIMEHNYSVGKLRLEQERKKAHQFLDRVLSKHVNNLEQKKL